MVLFIQEINLSYYFIINILHIKDIAYLNSYYNLYVYNLIIPNHYNYVRYECFDFLIVRVIVILNFFVTKRICENSKRYVRLLKISHFY